MHNEIFRAETKRLHSFERKTKRESDLHAQTKTQLIVRQTDIRKDKNANDKRNRCKIKSNRKEKISNQRFCEHK